MLGYGMTLDLLEIGFDCIDGAFRCVWIDIVDLNDQTATRLAGGQSQVKRLIKTSRWNHDVRRYLIVLRNGLIDEKSRRRRRDGKFQTSSDRV
jgi:hypothetical protein